MPQPDRTLAEQLTHDLHKAFDYTSDNNRDLLGDETFPMHQVVDEIEVQRAYQYLVAYISRNSEMIELNLKDD